MSSTRIEKPDLPEYMTWEELERLPEELADRIELRDGRVVWVRRGPRERALVQLGKRWPLTLVPSSPRTETSPFGADRPT
jgi:hypothetical protein